MSVSYNRCNKADVCIMSMINVYAAHEADAAAVADMESAVFSKPWSKSDVFAYIKEGSVLICALDGDICGYAIIDTRVLGETELLRIAVLPEYRGKGCACALMDELFRVSKELNAERSLLEVREGNVSAIALYKKYGFVIDGIRKNYYREPTENAVLMSVQL